MEGRERLISSLCEGLLARVFWGNHHALVILLKGERCFHFESVARKSMEKWGRQYALNNRALEERGERNSGLEVHLDRQRDPKGGV